MNDWRDDVRAVLMAVWVALAICGACAIVGLITVPIVPVFKVRECAKEQLDDFGDLCAESDGDTKFDGVQCAVESILMCVEGR